MARILDAADGRPSLPSLVDSPTLLCGHELASLEQERAFYAKHCLNPMAAGVALELRPGQLLVFDNLAVAHGRSGRRLPGELHQMMLGYRDLDVSYQIRLRTRILDALVGTGVDAP